MNPDLSHVVSINKSTSRLILFQDLSICNGNIKFKWPNGNNNSTIVDVYSQILYADTSGIFTRCGKFVYTLADRDSMLA